MTYTSWNIQAKAKKPRQCPADRTEHAKRFRALLADLGLNHPDAAKMLHVSLRTLHNWLSGRQPDQPSCWADTAGKSKKNSDPTPIVLV